MYNKNNIFSMKIINKKMFDQLKKDCKSFVLMFKISNCKYCPDMQLVLEKLEKKKKIAFYVCSLDKEDEEMQSVIKDYGIMAVPYTIFFLKAKIVAIITGIQTLEYLSNLFDEKML